MGRIYTLNFTAASIASASGDYDLFEIGPADDKPVILHRLVLGQYSELGEAQEEQLRISIIRGNTSSGNGSSTTPVPVIPSDAAAGAACETIGSTPASAGTAVTAGGALAWPLRIGLDHIWLPEDRPMCTQAQGLICVRLMAAAADDLNAEGTLWFEELG